MVKKTEEPEIKRVLLTEAGLRKLEEELEQLTTEGRKEVAKRLKEAIAYGDLSENAEYDEAKNQQAFIEARVAQLEKQIKGAEIIKKSQTDVVQIGSTVTLRCEEDGESHEYKIVGSTEADPMAHKISNESPVGEAILGKKVKEKVKIKAPGGEFTYEILKVA